MSYIQKELFLDLPFTSQSVLIEWWKTEIGDIVYFPLCKSIVEIKNKEACDINDNDKKGYIDKITNKPVFLRIPIFSDIQLKKFIEDKTSNVISVEESDSITYLYLIKIGDNTIYSNDLLKTYWMEAIKIIKNIKKVEFF